MDFIKSDFLQNPYFNKFENLIFKNSNPWSVEQKIDLGFQKHLKGGKLCCYLKKKASAMKKMCLFSMYSPVHKCWPKTSWAGNQGNNQNFDPSLIPKELWLIFIGLKQKKKNWQIKFKMADSKKLAEICSNISKILIRFFTSSVWNI